MGNISSPVSASASVYLHQFDAQPPLCLLPAPKEGTWMPPRGMPAVSHCLGLVSRWQQERVPRGEVAREEHKINDGSHTAHNEPSILFPSILFSFLLILRSQIDFLLPVFLGFFFSFDFFLCFLFQVLPLVASIAFPPKMCKSLSSVTPFNRFFT